MKRVFSRALIDLTTREFNTKILKNIPFLPSSEQFERLMQEDDSKPVSMLNFLKYHKTAKYPPGYARKSSREITGEEAYGKYGKHVIKVVAKLGGCIDYTGKILDPLVGDLDVEWDDFAIMRYPSNQTFYKMFTVKTNEKGAIHRDAGIANTSVIAFTPETKEEN